MNPAHVHLITNHLPVLGTLFGVLLLAAGWVRRSEDLKKGGLIVFVLAGLSAAPAYFSGREAEEIVEGLPGIEEALIEEHEESAEASAAAAAALGVLSLAALLNLRGQKPVSVRWAALCLAAGLATAALMAVTANKGGRIAHPEVRPGFVSVQAEPEK